MRQPAYLRRVLALRGAEHVRDPNRHVHEQLGVRRDRSMLGALRIDPGLLDAVWGPEPSGSRRLQRGDDLPLLHCMPEDVLGLGDVHQGLGVA